MAIYQFPQSWTVWLSLLAEPLQARLAWRLGPMLLGVLFSRGRQTVSSWLRAAGLGADFKAYYYFLGSLGRRVKRVASRLLRILLPKLAGDGDRLLFAIDDTPTKRYGPQVQGAGLHHNPTPGPADQKFVYGHVWVTIALVVRHRLWGTIGLPLLSLLYVRRKDIGSIAPWEKVTFKTKLELAAELVEWVAGWLRCLGKRIWAVVDGAYVKREFLYRSRQAEVTVVGRLRKDAALRDVPGPPKKGQRGRPRIYGTTAISLAKRAGQKKGWETGTFRLYGEEVVKKYKTFLATYRPACGLIRVVLVRETAGWFAFFCTDPSATVAQILEAVADRTTIEQVFHDLKEVHGVGKQQVRHYWASLACFNLQCWLHSLIECWAWDLPHQALCDRRNSPWDNASRRPSHADRRNALRRACVQQEINRATQRNPIRGKLKKLVQTLLNCVT
jgi:hypothetical protein